MSTPIFNSSKKPERLFPASVLLALLVLIAFLAGVIALLGWGLAWALGLDFWSGLVLVGVAIVVLQLGTRQRKS